MSRELEFDGYWEGQAVYFCDTCGKLAKFRFDDEEEAKNVRGHRKKMWDAGWLNTKVNGYWKDFCTENCRNKYIKNNTI